MKLLNYPSLSAVLAVVTVGLIAFPCQAQQSERPKGRPEQFGAINLEQEEAAKDPYRVSQDAALTLFKTMDSRVSQLAGGASASPLDVPDNVINYLTGAYLFCTVRSGTCQLPLDALLEIDVINARLNRSGECPVLTRFWKAWVKSDMEKRQEYSIPTGLLEPSQKFRDEVRPRFIRCRDTLKQETSGSNDNAVYFKDRYREGARSAALPGKMVAFIEMLKAKVPNVFLATGAMKGDEIK